MDIKGAIYAQARRLKKIRASRVETPNHFHASSAGDCCRSLYFKHLGRKSEAKDNSPDDEARVEILLAEGAGLHQAQITDLIKQAPGIHITNIEEDRVLNFGEFIISGHPDGLLHDTKSKTKWILEVKGLSISSCGYRGKERLRDEEIDTLKTVYPKAIPQTRIYSHMYDTDGGIVIVKNKDNCSLFQFTIARDKKSEERIFEKFRNIHTQCKEYPEGNSSIPCDWLKSDSKCRFCPYPKECGYGK